MKYPKYQSPEPYRPSNLEILGCLISQPQWLKLLCGKGKSYEKLLDYIINLSEIQDTETMEFPSIKSISEVIIEKVYIVTKWIPKIYDDLYELNHEHPEQFKSSGQKYEMTFKSSFHQGAYFTIWLQTPLQKYDRFSFFFISAKVEDIDFWVKDITHYFTKGHQTKTVKLNANKFNLYREYILAQAEFHKLIIMDERYHLLNFQLDDRFIEP